MGALVDSNEWSVYGTHSLVSFSGLSDHCVGSVRCIGQESCFLDATQVGVLYIPCICAKGANTLRFKCVHSFYPTLQAISSYPN